ncbi:putative transposable element [Penicillium digitatum]|uniref:Putative transposable element n=1 Tax=Penicillium digitatum TaxID=36651 RepID=A0A7T6XUN8_PENDI|nr:putative transposable element [Penicillium digitatum]
MADTETDNEGDTNPHPLDASTNPLEPQIPSFTNPIQFTQDDSDSEDEDNTPPHQGHGLPAIAMTKIQKVRTLEHNDTDPSGWKQALAYQLIPYALEWLLDSNIPRPHKSHTSFGRWKYWSRLVASWMYNQIDVTLRNKLRNLSKMPKYADQLYDELISMTQGSDRMQTAFIEMRKFDKMKRSDYNSASEYIEEYQRQYHVLARFKAAPQPSHGLSQVLQNIELEVMKVQFIREEVASLEPKKLTLDKVEEYWRALQAAADMEGVANATYNNNAGRGRGNGRGGRGGNRGGRGGHNNNGHNDDNTQSNKDTNAVEDDTATAKKKKKKGLRKQPADGKDIHEYANEMRNGTQKDDNNMCSFCGFGPHTAKRCAYLSENPPVSWEPSGNLWAYSKAIQRAQRQDGQNNMVVAAANSVDRRNDWLLDTGSDKTLTHDIEDFHTYQLDHPDTAYAYKDYSGNRVVTLGHGQIIVRTALPGRNGKTHSFMTTGYYTQGGHGKLLGMQKLLEEQDISYDTRTKYLTNGEGDIVGYGDTSTGVPYLVSPKDDDDPNEVKSDIDSDSDDEEIGFVNKVTAYEIHRRLGHAGKARIASTLQHAEQLGDDEQYGTEHFDCDACFQGKSKLKISRQPQARVQDVAWKFHVDTQPMKPTGPNGENYWLPVVDDASRLIEGIMLKNKSDAYYKLTAFCEKIKLLTGRYPGIWRMDGGTEFKEFIKWGEKHGMTFEITPPYTAEPNGTVERFGGHINDIQRTMIIDAKMTEEMWPYATDTAIYIYNRLINPKTKISPLTHWRQELEIPNAEPSLKHLKPWGTTAYVHIPKPKRIQARKAAPRAWKGKLVGYEGDGGHVYKVWDPATRKLVVSRDVGFPQPGDDDNDDTGSMLVNGVPTDLKDLGEPKQYLNCALHRDYDNCTITMSQEAYIQKVLRTANAGSGWKDTPLPAAWRESPANASNVLDDDSFDQYQSVVGMLNWLAVKTRPDIRFAVTRLQHRLANPTFEDLHAMQHVVKYLRHMPDVGITLGRTPELRFYAHVDASHADWEDSKSTEGSIWYFAGSPVIWTTKKQTITANSTTVAEWCALDQPTRDAMWLGKIARSFMLPEQRPIEIHTDNINSQLLLTKKGGKSANRWLDLRWFFVKDAVAQGHVDIRRVDTKKNAADGFTKALAKEQFETFVGLIGMI